MILISGRVSEGILLPSSLTYGVPVLYVKCDEENNPQSVRDLGQVIIEIGMAPVKPAEFVIFRISQWATGSDTSE
jgi:phage tail sheath protein FI